MKQLAKDVWLILRLATVATYRDGLMDIAKGVAFSAMLSFFPVMTSVATLLIQANAERVSSSIARFLFEVVPPGTQDLVQYAFTMRGSRPAGLLAGATLISIWAASDVIVSLMSGFQAAYRSPNTRSFWHQRGMAVVLVFFTLLPAVGASALLVFNPIVESAVLYWLGFLPGGAQMQGFVALLIRALAYVVALCALVTVTGVLYRFAPSLPKRWKRVWPGALMATGLWSVATLGFGWYVRNIATYNVMYGSIGAAIALLVWLYLLSLIALYGCEFNAEGERLKRAGRVSSLY